MPVSFNGTPPSQLAVLSFDLLSYKAKVIIGGNDASIFNARGIATAVLGIGDKAAHSKEEHIAIADMGKVACPLRGWLFHPCTDSADDYINLAVRPSVNERWS